MGAAIENHWIHTPQGNWLYAADPYCGIVVDLGGTRLARIEDSEVIHPADVTFLIQADAQAWVERMLTGLPGDAEDEA